MFRRLLNALLCLGSAGYLDAQVENASLSIADLEREVQEYFSLKRFEKAVAVLERAAAADPKNARISSLLGSAYLYVSSTPGKSLLAVKARAEMEKAIEGGDAAVFLVSKAKPQSRFTRGKEILAVTPGELRLTREEAVFAPSRDEDKSGPYRKEDLKECGPNSGWGKSANAFHIKTTKDTLDFRPQHFSKEEGELACALAEKYLGVKRDK